MKEELAFVEVIFVIAIISILASIVIPNVQQAKAIKRQQELRIYMRSTASNSCNCKCAK
jgi:type II secretory pathway pseudopilin PulG